MNDVVLKMFISYAKSLHRYVRMKHLTFLILQICSQISFFTFLFIYFLEHFILCKFYFISVNLSSNTSINLYQILQRDRSQDRPFSLTVTDTKRQRERQDCVVSEKDIRACYMLLRIIHRVMNS